MDGPSHVGIIMDGNRRYARARGEKPWKGHLSGRDKLKEVLEWAEEAGVLTLTLFALSIQNLNRDKHELSALFSLMREHADELLGRIDELAERGVRVRFVGRLDLLPEDVRSPMQRIMQLTVDNAPYTLNLAVAYGGREELLDAFRRLAQGVEKGAVSASLIDEERISQSLWVDGEPDMIIRTGGERRTSNFLVWQSWYSEWFFLDTMWPALSKEEFLGCIKEFSSRQRRYGR